MKRLIALMSLLLISCSYHKHHHKHGHSAHHRFQDAEKWAQRFEHPSRDKWQEPEKVIQKVGVKEDSLIADIGSATGYFPVRLAKVASKGRVWGIDVEPNLVDYLNNRAKKENITNLISIKSNDKDPMIPTKMDFIFMVNTYHHIEDRVAYFKKVRKKLKKNGKVIIIDFKKEKLPLGPPVQAKVSKQKIAKELKKAGLKLTKAHSFLKYQNLLEFKAK